jgi:hypothetical protein
MRAPSSTPNSHLPPERTPLTSREPQPPLRKTFQPKQPVRDNFSIRLATRQLKGRHGAKPHPMPPRLDAAVLPKLLDSRPPRDTTCQLALRELSRRRGTIVLTAAAPATTLPTASSGKLALSRRATNRDHPASHHSRVPDRRRIAPNASSFWSRDLAPSSKLAHLSQLGLGRTSTRARPPKHELTTTSPKSGTRRLPPLPLLFQIPALPLG